MDAKIRELTDKIFNEGVEKGKQQANQLIAEAEQKSQDILSMAKTEADRILKEAEKTASELKKNTESELRLYAGQTLEALKAAVVDSITDKIVNANIKSATENPDFMRSVILKVVQNWTPGEEVIIETADAKALETYLASNVKDLLDRTVTVQEAAGYTTNFVLKPKDGAYKVEFGQEELVAFFKNFLRPRLVEMLF